MLLVIAPCCLSCLQPVAVAREMGDAGDARAPGAAGALPPSKRAAEELRAPNVACFDRAVLSSDRALSPSPNPADAASLSLSAPVASLSASGGGAAHPICSSC